MNERRRWGVAAVVAVWLTAGGCIEYFAEPPDLGPVPLVDGGGVAGDAGDIGPDGCAASIEVCDGVDNDCDGHIDEGAGEALCPPPDRNADTADRVCQDGSCVLACYGGRHDLDGRYENGCEYGPCIVAADGLEACDGDDNDCDGVGDEEVIGAVVPGLSGVCAGARRGCNGGAGWGEPRLEDITGYEADEARCDGLDNDCDGQVDEDIPGCEVGCDGVDDDGDGRSDEGCAEVLCGAERFGAPVPPCNGCPDGVAVPSGWVCIPAGELTMGSPPDEAERDDNEAQWPVELSQPFFTQATEVTQGEWRAVFGDNPSGFQPCDPDDPDAADDCPVETVNWYEAVEYTVRRSAADGLRPCYAPLAGCVGEPGEGMECHDAVVRVADCDGYRLPTEAEWEYAARAGAETRYWSGDDEADLAAVGWYGDNSGGHPHPVGRLPANAWGLFDVHGNVREWVWDWYGAYPAAPPAVDPAGPPMGADRVIRGGSWGSTARVARSAHRSRRRPGLRDRYLGFRVIQAAPRGAPDS